MRVSNTIIISFFCIVFILFCGCDNEPYEGPLSLKVVLTCEQVEDLAADAYTDFLNSNTEILEENCLAYLAALEQQVISCPENTDELSNRIAELNACEFNSFFKVDFDGDTFLANSAFAHIGNGKLTITGERDNEKFELIAYQTIEGTYQFGSTDAEGNVNSAAYIPNIITNEVWTTVSNNTQVFGEIIISEINYSDLRISGIFNFTAFKDGETKVFTNGLFINIPLTKDNDFFALVDGVEFEEHQFIPYVNENSEMAGFIVLNEDNTAVMDFTFHVNTLPNTYNLSLIPSLPRAGYTGNPDYYYHGSGTFTVIAHNTTARFIMGSFEFIGEFETANPETYTITEGRFCINY